MRLLIDEVERLQRELQTVRHKRLARVRGNPNPLNLDKRALKP